MNGLQVMSRPGSIGIFGISNWNSAQGIGRLASNYGESEMRAFLRGGHWYGGSDIGILTLLLYYPSNFTNNGLGLRVSWDS